MKITPAKLFTFFARGEGVTWALLISALIARAAGLDAALVTIAGGVHGAVFLGYAVTAALVGVNQRWSLSKVILGIALAIVPFATVPFERSLAKSGSLIGQWRTEKSSDPRDSNWFDSLFRWYINRPWFLLLTLLTAVSAIFSFLLWLGPPDQWFDN